MKKEQEHKLERAKKIKEAESADLKARIAKEKATQIKIEVEEKERLEHDL